MQHILWLIAHSGREFQSSPGPKAGCNVIRPYSVIFLCEFQSSPGPKAGCNFAVSTTSMEAGMVSILTRPESRMQLITRVASLHGIQCFNPHPAERPEIQHSHPRRSVQRPHYSGTLNLGHFPGNIPTLQLCINDRVELGRFRGNFPGTATLLPFSFRCDMLQISIELSLVKGERHEVP